MLLIGIAGCGVLAAPLAPPDAGTREDREALMRYIVEKTILRTAWSPFTAGRP